MATVYKNFVVKNGLISEDGNITIENAGDFIVQNVSADSTFEIDGATGAVTIGTTDGYTLPTADGTAGQFLQTDGNGNISFNNVPSGQFTLSDGTNTDVFVTGNTLTFDSGTGITTTVSDDQISFAITNTGVTAATYGSSTTVPQITVNAQGQITSVTDAPFSTSFTIAADAGTADTFNNGETFTFSGGTGLTSTVADNQVTFDLDDTAVTADSYGAAGTVATFTVDGQGRLTAASDVTISITKSQISDLGAVLYNVVEDTTPQLGGNLDLNSNDITGTGNINTTGTVTVTGDADFGGKIIVGDSSDANATSVIEAAGTLWLDPNPTAGDVGGVVVIKGDLQIDGTTTTINSTTLTVDDLNVVVASGAASAAAADGAGLTVDGANATFTYDAANDRWTANKDIATNIVGDVTGNLTGNVTGDLTGDIYASDGTSKVLENGTDGTNATFTGNVSGDLTGDVTGNVTGNVTGDLTGNADTATALETARTIGGVSFDGTANIDLPGVNTTGNQDTSGNAATATALETARTIELTGDVAGSASFDGTANASIAVTISADSVALGTDTTGDYVQSISGTNGIVVNNGTGEGSTPTVTTANTVTLGSTDTAIHGHKQASISAATQYEVETQTAVVGSKIVFGAVDSADATSRHMIEVIVLTDGTDTYITQYAEVFTSVSLFTLAGGTTAGDITITPTTGKTINIKVVEQTI